jgi:predicted metallopeptidase
MDSASSPRPEGREPRPQLRRVASPTVGFDFTGHIRLVCQDIVTRLPDFAHIDMPRVAIRFCTVRRPGPYGMQASLTPLRFKGGEVETVRRGKRYRVQPVVDATGQEMLYLLSFYLPRFLNQSFAEKIATICHELWHIGPEFDGDIRRHGHGRCYAHGPSEQAYHAAMQELARRWLALDPPEALYEPLREDFRSLHLRHGGLYGVRMATPKLQLVR